MEANSEILNFAQGASHF